MDLSTADGLRKSSASRVRRRTCPTDSYGLSRAISRKVARQPTFETIACLLRRLAFPFLRELIVSAHSRGRTWRRWRRLRSRFSDVLRHDHNVGAGSFDVHSGSIFQQRRTKDCSVCGLRSAQNWFLNGIDLARAGSYGCACAMGYAGSVPWH